MSLPLRRDRDDNPVARDDDEQQQEGDSSSSDTDDAQRGMIDGSTTTTTTTSKQNKNQNDDDDDDDDDDPFHDDRKEESETGDDDDRNKSDDLKSLHLQESRAAEQQQQQKIPDPLLKQMTLILGFLRRPTESPYSALERLSASPSSQQQQQRSDLAETITQYHDLESTLSPAMITLSLSAAVEVAIEKMTRDDILAKILGSSSSPSSPPLQQSFLLFWSQLTQAPPPPIALASLSVRNSPPGLVGPFSASEINGWGERGFFEQKAAFVCDLNVAKRKWIAVPRAKVENIVSRLS